MRLRAFYVASVLACCACGVRCERPIHKADTVCWFRQQNGHIYIYIRHTTHIQDEMKSKDQRPAINWIKIVGCETTIFGLLASKAARIFFFDFPIHKRIFISEYSTHRHTHTLTRTYAQSHTFGALSMLTGRRLFSNCIANTHLHVKTAYLVTQSQLDGNSI